MSPIQRPILYGLGQVPEAYPLLPGQVGDGPRHFEPAMVGARADAELHHRLWALQ